MAYAVDLCCGTGGWSEGLSAAGLDVVGYDVLRNPLYRWKFINCPVQYLTPGELAGASVVCASPPCDEFSRHDQPWTRRRNPPVPDLTLIHHILRITRDANVPL